MTDLLRQGATWLGQMRTAFCSSPVTYRRDATELAVNATLGRSQVEVTDDYGAAVQTSAVDFLILAADLGLEPQAGDVIVCDGRRYEVMDLPGEGCWRWSDPYRTSMRVHTKDTGPAGA